MKKRQPGLHLGGQVATAGVEAPDAVLGQGMVWQQGHQPAGGEIPFHDKVRHVANAEPCQQRGVDGVAVVDLEVAPRGDGCDPLRDLLGLAAGGCIDAGIDGVADGGLVSSVDAEAGGQVVKIVITVPLHGAEGEQG